MHMLSPATDQWIAHFLASRPAALQVAGDDHLRRRHRPARRPPVAGQPDRTGGAARRRPTAWCAPACSAWRRKAGWSPAARAGAAAMPCCRRRARASSAPTAASTRRPASTGTAAGPCCWRPTAASTPPCARPCARSCEWEGYAMLAPGLLAHPAADPRRRWPRCCARVDGAGKIFVCSASELPGVRRAAAGASWCAKAGTCPASWPATAASSTTFAPLLALLRGERALDAAAGLRDAQPADPRLPPRPAARPDAAAGAAAAALARGRTRTRWRSAIYRHVCAAGRAAPDGRACGARMRRSPAADAAFYERFGGLLER